MLASRLARIAKPRLPSSEALKISGPRPRPAAMLMAVAAGNRAVTCVNGHGMQKTSRV